MSFIMNDPAQTDLSQFHEAKQDNANKPAGDVGAVREVARGW